MSKFRSLFLGAVVTAVVCCGCYEYPKPPSATLGDSYTHRERDKAEDMFKGIKVFTLADAQRIAIQNNPNYISASQSINAARFRYYQALGMDKSPKTGAYVFNEMLVEESEAKDFFAKK